jgi:cytochrome P450
VRPAALDPTPPVDLSGVNLLDPWLYATGDPHAVWRHLRRHAPVYEQKLENGGAFWAVTKYDDVGRVLKNHAEFTSQRGTMLCILDQPDIAAGKMMAVTDPPRHTVLREPLARALARTVAAQRPGLGRIVADLLDPGLSGEPCDFAATALMFPMAFTGTLMGLPRADWARLARLTTMSIAPEDPEFAAGPPQATLRRAHHELFEYFAGEVGRRRRSPAADDLIGHLTTMRVDGARLAEDEIIFNCYSLLLGANVTTPHAASATVLALAGNPDEYRRWAANPALLSSGIEEGLRWSSPASHFMRYARDEVDVRGVTIPAGAAVTAWLGSANRDEDVFPDPDRFDAGRQPNRHVAFGLGPHHCIGAPLARLALGALFSALLARVERIEPAGPVERLVSNFVAGIKHLRVRMIPRC